MWFDLPVTLAFQAGPIIGALIVGYVLGSIPFGLIVTHMAGLGDIRNIGSGNIGATNVLRTGRYGLAALTFAADLAKGSAPVLIAGALAGPVPSVVAGVAAIAGHIFPVWLGFKGGKGVSTYFGILLGLAWPVALLSAASWIGAALLWRYSSLSALVAALVAPALLAVFGLYWIAVPIFLSTVLVYWRHRDNISRLLGGTETRIGDKSKSATLRATSKV